MKRIIISVTNDLFSDQRVHRVAKTLTDSGAEILLVGRLLPGSNKLLKRPYNTYRMNIPFKNGFLFYAFYNIRLFFFLLFKKADGLLSNDLDTLPANFIVSKIKKIPLVFDSHEYFPEVPELIHRRKVRAIWLLIEKVLLPEIKYGYTVCGSIANIYKQKYNTNFEVIRNLSFGRRDNFSPAPKLAKAGTKIIIYQGALNIGRGIELVIDAMKFIDNAVFVIAGEGDISGKLLEKVKQSGYEDKIMFTGRIPLNDLFGYTVQADLGISLEENLGLNYYYALPNKLFDYIQAGVPVLTSYFPEMAAIVKQYNIGYTTNERNPEKLSVLIKEMLDNQILRKTWKGNLVPAAKELCWENEQEKLKEIFRKAGLI